MPYVKFDHESRKILNISPLQSEGSIEISSELASQFQSNPKMFMFYMVDFENNIVENFDLTTIINETFEIEKFCKWPTWSSKNIERPSIANINVMVTLKENKALVHNFGADIDGLMFFTDASDDMHIVATAHQIKTDEIVTYNKKRKIDVWSSNVHKKCFIVDNDVFEELSNGK